MPKAWEYGELANTAHAWLEAHPGAVQVHMPPTSGADAAAISEWETRNGVLLPDDVSVSNLVTTLRRLSLIHI